MDTVTIRITNPDEEEKYKVGDVFTGAVRSDGNNGWYVTYEEWERYYIADRECEVVEYKPKPIRIRLTRDCLFFEEKMPEGSEWFVSSVDPDGDYRVEFEPGEIAVVSTFEAEEIPGDIPEVFENIRNQQSAPKHDDSVDAALSIEAYSFDDLKSRILGTTPHLTIVDDVEEDVSQQHHYAKWPIEPIKFIQENSLPFCEGNVIKYIMRWKDKGGVKDLMKAKQYIDFLIEKEVNKVLPDNTSQYG